MGSSLGRFTRNEKCSTFKNLGVRNSSVISTMGPSSLNNAALTNGSKRTRASSGTTLTDATLSTYLCFLTT